MAQPEAQPRVHAVIFSKDRPFQLHESVRTLLDRRSGVDLALTILWQASDAVFVTAYERVLTHWSTILPPLGVATNFVRETHFALDLCRILDSCLEACSSAVLFGVDDAVWLPGADLLAAALALRTYPCVRGVLLKLHPGVCYGHPADEAFDPPTFRRLPRYAPGASDLFAWELPSGREGIVAAGDFGYPVDLCAGLYRAEDVMRLVRGILQGSMSAETLPRDMDAPLPSLEVIYLRRYGAPVDVAACTALSHPNRLEVSLNNEFLRCSRQKADAASASACGTWLACPGSPACVVITVNRVQDVFLNAIYDDLGGSLGARSLLGCVRGVRPEDETSALTSSPGGASATSRCPVSRHFDVAWYSARRRDWTSVHISDWITLPCACGVECPRTETTLAEAVAGAGFSVRPVSETSQLVSVLMPAFNASSHLRRALLSVLRQSYPRLQAVLVDDGSTDDTAAVARGVFAECGLTAAPEGYCSDAPCDTGTSLAAVLPPIVTFFCSTFDSTTPCAVLVQLPVNSGIASALNVGLRYCSGEFIARADADDICDPDRVTLQVGFLLRHPGVHLVGATVEVAFESPDPCRKRAGCPLSDHPLVLSHPRHPEAVLWRMLTHHCVIAHPAVMGLRHVFCGGDPARLAAFYPDSATTRWAEDYAAWLAALVPTRPVPSSDSDPKPLRVSNVGGSPLVVLSKRGQGRQGDRVRAQRSAAFAAVAAALLRFMGPMGTNERPVPSPDAVAVMQLGSHALLHWEDVAPAVQPLLSHGAKPGSSNYPPLEAVRSACELLVQVEEAFLSNLQVAACQCERGEFGSSRSIAEYVRRDVTARLGEIATCAVGAYGPPATSLLLAWLERRGTRGASGLPRR